MQCPFCGARDTKVLDSRPAEHRIRRRRECIFCGKRFTTYEMVERPLLMVKKRDGSFEPFDRQKLITGIFNAIKKRPVSVEQVAAIAEGIEQQCANAMRSTVTSVDIGNWVMEHLKRIDAVAYIRFASVYEDFTDVASFVAAISALDEELLLQKQQNQKNKENKACKNRTIFLNQKTIPWNLMHKMHRMQKSGRF